ncbi:MAG: hypothetical protein QW038_00390 [Nanopusillaceae archaeon]
MIPSYRIKRRYILLEHIPNIEEKIKEKYIYFFGFFNFSKAKIKIIFSNDKFDLISINRKCLYKLIFVLYLIKARVLKIYKTIKEFKKEYNVSF